MKTRDLLLSGETLILATLLGCAGIAGRITPADLEAPMVNVGGPWWDTGSQIDFVQNGDQVTGNGRAFSGAYACVYKGKVTGRVVRGTLTYVGRTENIDFAFIVSPDGRTARYVMEDLFSTMEFPFYRVVVGASSKYASLSIEPLLCGGIVGQYSVTQEGVCLGTPNASYRIRDALVTVQYFRNVKGIIKPWFTYVPIEAPRASWCFELLLASSDAGTLELQKKYVEGMKSLRKESALQRKQQGSIDGRTCWWILAPFWEYRSPDLLPTHIMGELYFEDPDTGAAPSECVWVAIRSKDGTWQPGSWYLIDAPKLTAYRGIIVNGKPARVEAEEAKEPPLDHFLLVKETYIWEARWRTRALLQAKNKTLPKVLRESKTSELSDLVGRLEQMVIDLSHESDMARDQAQKKVEASALATQEIRENKRDIGQIQTQLQDQNLDVNVRSGLQARLQQLQGAVAIAEQQQRASESDVDQLREMSTVYKERIEVLKPFLPAIKEEIANRGK